MENQTLLTYLEYMKSDIYYLNSKIKQTELLVNESFGEKYNSSQELGTNIEYLKDQILKLHNRVNELELNQENISQFLEDIDLKVQKTISKKNNEDSKSQYLEADSKKNKLEISKETLEVLNNSLSSAINRRVKEIEDNFEMQISKIYDTMYNEILDLKVEIKKIKKVKRNKSD